MSDEPDAASVQVIDLLGLAQASPAGRPVWSGTSPDLHLNLLVLPAGETVEPHVNAEVDVLLVGIDGAGSVEVDGVRHALEAGQAILVPKGTRRAIAAAADRFAYLACHRRRPGLWPVRRQ